MARDTVSTRRGDGCPAEVDTADVDPADLDTAGIDTVEVDTADARTAGPRNRGRPPHPYEQPSRSGRAGRWRPLLEVPLFVLLALVVVTVLTVATVVVRALVSVACLRCPGPEPLWLFVLEFGWIAALLVALALTLRLAGGRGIGSVSSVAGRLRLRRLRSCVPPALVLVGLHVAVLVAREPSWVPALWPGWGVYAGVVVVAVLVVPLQAAAEEYVTRGWLVQTVAVWTRFRWLAALPGIVVFVVLHGPTDGWLVADLTVFAVACCWITFRTGGLEAAIVLHAANNVLLTLVGGTQGIPDPTAELPDLTLVDVLPGMVVAVLYVWWVATRVDGRRDRDGVPAGPTP